MFRVGPFFIRNLSPVGKSVKSYLIAEQNPYKSVEKLSEHLTKQGYFSFTPTSEAIARHTGVAPRTPISIVETADEEGLISEVENFSRRPK
ncbi:Uncharacterised protein [Legionella lansingensis]|uniref:Uncharacterized protein n=1 Tax=Legionella lansingensis TaxID=45067 RepID=A0A0W0VHH9_9GAMM|nr:hypothetical protein [Legionella lansingensis]KTD19598.1 hypothetical protein Llan_2060 [Legionella lansingensis]SNV50174.1 Uncharacterised protein [Legionella lansingensis]